MKTGRPKTKTKLRNFKLTAEANDALEAISHRCGWTFTRAVERAVLFAHAHRDFGCQIKEKP